MFIYPTFFSRIWAKEQGVTFSDDEYYISEVALADDSDDGDDTDNANNTGDTDGADHGDADATDADGAGGADDGDTDDLDFNTRMYNFYYRRSLDEFSLDFPIFVQSYCFGFPELIDPETISDPVYRQILETVARLLLLLKQYREEKSNARYSNVRD